MSVDDQDDRVENQIAAPLRAARPLVDEVHRARLLSGIEAELDRVQDRKQDQENDRARAAAPARRRRFWLAGAGALASAAICAVALLGTPHRPPRVAMTAPVPVPVAPALLMPVRPNGASEPAAPSTDLLALAGERLRATIGARVRLTLVGPGRVSVLPVARPGEIELALDGGRLLVAYDGRAGGTLRVHSPGAVTTVVGTLFAVDAGVTGSRVAVAHGRVRTEDRAGQVWQVATGSSWNSGDGQVGPLPGEVAAALAEHEAAWNQTIATPPPAAAPPHPARPHHPAAAPRSDNGRDLEILYAHAEEAMRKHALAEARRTLEAIASGDPDGTLGEAAILDLARLALAEGDRAEARRALARLPASFKDPALVETAAHLRCRAEGESCAPPAGQ